PRRMKVFIYSNGLKIDSYDADNLEEMHIEALNIGIHNKNQIRHIKFRDFIYGRTFSTRIMVQNTKYHEFFKSLKNQSLLVTEDHIKTWQMNDCNMPNEDWMVLQ
ncbi:MAG TPA: hypothetical protein VEP89_04940, partial [Draconibacterium sp.]|nr:hypothetical protein [Draconibacterium sp.]